jgi:ornithine carbamoyltransferase
MYQGIEFRGYHHEDVEQLAEFSGVPVWNGLTDKFHPTQVLADLLTVYEVKKTLKGLRITFVGDAHNNVANSLMIGAAMSGMHFTALAPKSLWPSENLVSRCQAIASNMGGSISLTEEVDAGVAKADVIYTDVWVSMGEPKEIWEQRIALLHDYQVNKEMIEKACKNAMFLHCLPSFHGLDTEIGHSIATQFGDKYPILKHGEMEVTNEVFESSNSYVFDQAENRMHTIKAIMLATLK